MHRIDDVATNIANKKLVTCAERCQADEKTRNGAERIHIYHSKKLKTLPDTHNLQIQIQPLTARHREHLGTAHFLR